MDQLSLNSDIHDILSENEFVVLSQQLQDEGELPIHSYNKEADHYKSLFNKFSKSNNNTSRQRESNIETSNAYFNEFVKWKTKFNQSIRSDTNSVSDIQRYQQQIKRQTEDMYGEYRFDKLHQEMERINQVKNQWEQKQRNVDSITKQISRIELQLNQITKKTNISQKAVSSPSRLLQQKQEIVKPIMEHPKQQLKQPIISQKAISESRRSSGQSIVQPKPTVAYKPDYSSINFQSMIRHPPVVQQINIKDENRKIDKKEAVVQTQPIKIKKTRLDLQKINQLDDPHFFKFMRLNKQEIYNLATTEQIKQLRHRFNQIKQKTNTKQLLSKVIDSTDKQILKQLSKEHKLKAYQLLK